MAPSCHAGRRALERPMYLMRIGAPGAEKPVARIDDDSYVDLSGVVGDFDEAFFGGERLDQNDGLGPLLSRALPEPVPCLGAGRSDQHGTPPGVGMGFRPPVWLQPAM